MRVSLLLAVVLSSVSSFADELPKVVVLDLQTDPASKDSARFVTEAILTELARTRRFEVIGSSDVQAMIGLERQRELLGCTDQATSCLAEISGALGAQFLVTGALGNIGKAQRLDLKLIDTRSAKVLVREGGVVTEDNLADRTNDAVKAILRALPKGGSASAVVEAADAPAGPSKPLAPKLLTAAGVVIAAAGFGFGISSASSFDPAGKPFTEAREQQAAAQSKATLGYIAGGVGVAAAAAGIAWWVMADEVAPVSIAPTRDGFMVAVTLQLGGGR